MSKYITLPPTRYAPGWGSHLPVLIRAVQVTTGAVLELGMGVFSTPVLHWLCVDRRRLLVSYETDGDWFEAHGHFARPHHELHLIEDWMEADLERPWSVALIDNGPVEARGECLRRLVPWAEIVLAHDCDARLRAGYGWGELLDGYRYRYEYRLARPFVAVLSNTIDVVKEMKDRWPT